MGKKNTTNPDGSPVAVSSTGWLDALGWHVANMKAREQEQARLRDEHGTKYEQIMRERMELENTIDKTKRI